MFVKWIFLILLFSYAYQTPYREYKFSSQTLSTATVADTGNQAQKYNLAFTPGNFYFYSDYRGVQFSGQYVTSTQVGTAYFIPSTQFYFQIFFYVCEVNEFTLFCLQDSTTANVPYLCLYTDENGQIFINMRLYKNIVGGTATNYYPSTGATGITLVQGWNWIGIKVWTLYGFSYVTYYQSDESQTSAANNKQTSVSYVWEGVFDQSQWNAGLVVIGCRMRDNTNLQVYGNCMKGYINYIKISPIADYTYNDETKFAATHICTATTGCNFCAAEYQNTCWELITTFSNQIIEEWDTLTSITYPTTLKGKVSALRNLAKNTDRTMWPTQIGGQGLLFGSNVWSYIMKDDNTATYYFPFPPRFTIEAWIKYDLNYTVTDGTLMNIFGKFTGANPTSLTSANRAMKVGFAVSNKYMRVYVNNLYYDVDYDFVASNKWQYISVEYDLVYAYSTGGNYKSTQITVWINDAQQVQARVDDAVNYVFSGYLIMGDGFQGLIRKVRVLNRTPCITQIPESLSFTTGACTNTVGDTSTLCDTTDKFYGDCDNVTIYYDPTWGCKYCHQSCHTCLNDSDNGCYSCNSLGHFLFNHTSTPTTYSVTQSCMCSNGTYYDSSLQQCIPCQPGCLVCTDSSSACGTCEDGYYKEQDGSCVQTCPTGFTGNAEYKICQIDNGQKILSSTRGNLLRDYIEEQVHIAIEDRKGCLFGEYWSNDYQQCFTCDSSCIGCQFIDGRAQCISCQNPLYLNVFDGCSYCKPSGLGMYTDSTGVCHEYCGDGRRYQNTDICDDGNTGPGDGCDSTCKVEQNYYCRYGYLGQKDQCFWITTTIKNYTVTRNNDIILEFTRPIQALSGEISVNDFDIMLITRNKYQVKVNWTMLNTDLPSNFLYLFMNLNQTIKTSSYYDNMIIIRYKNTGNIVDTYNQYGNQVNIPKKRQLQSTTTTTATTTTVNDPQNKFHEIKQNLTIKTFLRPKTYFTSYDKDQTELYAKIMLYLIAGSITLQLTIGFILKKTIAPSFIILLSWQQVFLTSVNDLFWTDKLKYFYSYLRYFQFEFQLISPENMSILLDLTQIRKQQQNMVTSDKMNEVYSQNLYQMSGYQYNSMLINANSKIIIMIVVLVMFFVVTSVEQGLQLFTNWRNIYLTRVAKYFYWTIPLTVLILFYYPLLLTIVLELNEQNNQGWYEKLSYTFTSLMLIGLAFFFIISWLIICIHTKNKKLKLIKRKFNILLKPFKHRSGIYTHYWVIQLIKLTVLAFLQSIVQDFATGPLAIQIIAVGAIGMYIVIVRPFKSSLSNIVAFIGELTILAVQVLSMKFITPGDSSDKQTYGDYIIYTCLASSAIQLLLLIFFNLKTLHDYFYQQEHGLFKQHDPTFRFGFKTRLHMTDKYDSYFYHHQQQQKNSQYQQQVGYRYDGMGIRKVSEQQEQDFDKLELNNDNAKINNKKYNIADDNNNIDISFDTKKPSKKQQKKPFTAITTLSKNKSNKKKVKKGIMVSVDDVDNTNKNKNNNIDIDKIKNDIFEEDLTDNDNNNHINNNNIPPYQDNDHQQIQQYQIYEGTDEDIVGDAYNIDNNNNNYNNNQNSFQSIIKNPQEQQYQQQHNIFF